MCLLIFIPFLNCSREQGTFKYECSSPAAQEHARIWALHGYKDTCPRTERIVNNAGTICMACRDGVQDLYLDPAGRQDCSWERLVQSLREEAQRREVLEAEEVTGESSEAAELGHAQTRECQR